VNARNIAIHTLPLAILVLLANLFGASGAAAPAIQPRKYRFEGKDVFNVSDGLRNWMLPNGSIMQFETMNNTTGQVSIAIESITRGLRRGDPRTLGSNSDKEEIPKGNTSRVSRSGSVLKVLGSRDKSFAFRNWSVPPSSNGEGDGESFKYVGAMVDGRFHQVEVGYEHDSHGTFLIDTLSNSLLYIHTGSEIAEISRDGERLLVMTDSLNSPLSFAVLRLGKEHVRVELQCLAEFVRPDQVVASLYGWYPAPNVGFGVGILKKLKDTNIKPRFEATPLQMVKKLDGWHVSVPDPERFSEISGMECRQW
jgi:hypothetical protein